MKRKFKCKIKGYNGTFVKAYERILTNEVVYISTKCEHRLVLSEHKYNRYQSEGLIVEIDDSYTVKELESEFRSDKKFLEKIFNEEIISYHSYYRWEEDFLKKINTVKNKNAKNKFLSKVMNWKSKYTEKLDKRFGF